MSLSRLLIAPMESGPADRFRESSTHLETWSDSHGSVLGADTTMARPDG